MDNNELQHHGIKGMKWGVRRTDAQLARARGSVSPKTQQTTTSAKGSSSKQEETSAKGSSSKQAENEEGPTSTKALKDRNERLRLEKEYKTMLMNDDDLKQRVDRLKLEKEYQQLTAKEKSKPRQLVEEILYTSAKTLATTFINKGISALVGKVFDKDGSGDDDTVKEVVDEVKGAAKKVKDDIRDASNKVKGGSSESNKQTSDYGSSNRNNQTKTSSASSKSEKTSFGSDDFDISGGSSRSSSKSKERTVYDADFVDISSSAGKSFFNDVFALPAPSTPALMSPGLPSPKDD